MTRPASPSIPAVSAPIVSPAAPHTSWRPVTPPHTPWTRYYKETRNAGPRRLLLDTLDLLDARSDGPGLAVDLGCGSGRATQTLHERTRWLVHAIDADPASRAFLEQRFPDGLPPRIRFDQCCLRSMHLPSQSVDLVWAGLSLPYLTDLDIGPVWQKIVAALKPGGVFAGDFFGPEHGHLGRDDMNFQSPAQMEKMLAGLFTIKCDRITKISPFSHGKPLMMDCYHVIARKSWER